MTILFAIAVLPCRMSVGAEVEPLGIYVAADGLPAKGICVVLGDPTGTRTLQLAATTELMFYVQVCEAKTAQTLRKTFSDKGLLGNRVFVGKGPDRQIHLAENLVDAVVAAGADVDVKEAMRVLRPLGVLQQGSKIQIKPEAPEGTDNWSHYRHGPDNNPVSTDQFAKAPYLTKFLAAPFYGPQPQVSVMAGGVYYRAYGHIANKPREWAMLGKLAAYSAYNGTRLWQKGLPKGHMIWRSTYVATVETFFVGIGEHCRLLEPYSGKERGVLTVPDEITRDKTLKWMALEGNMLVALLGPQEAPEKELRASHNQHGWAWTKIIHTAEGYKYKDPQGVMPWETGSTLVAFDVKKQEILWHFKEKDPIDARAICMNKNRIFYYAHKKAVGSVNIKDGKPAWRTTDPAMLEALGDHHKAQKANFGQKMTAYMQCSDQMIYFGGPTRMNVLALKAADGKLAWVKDLPHTLIVRTDETLYLIAGRTDVNRKKTVAYDPISGAAKLNVLYPSKGGCARPTCGVDGIYIRGGGMTSRLSFDRKSRGLFPMRPDCVNGVLFGSGHAYWGPWMCDCNSAFVGQIALVNAGDYAPGKITDASSRLETGTPFSGKVAAPRPDDWPTYRKDLVLSAGTAVTLPARVKKAWTYKIQVDHARKPVLDTEGPTAPITANGTVYVADGNGVVHAVDAKTGAKRWVFYTGGPVVYPPTYAEGRLFVGSGDGWVYALDAASGSLLWRFRAAPRNRRIPVYGQLASTWPVHTGVVVKDGTAYFGAGMSYLDGTYMYAVDAATGALTWETHNGQWKKNRWGPHKDASGLGHLLLAGDQLYIPGGFRTGLAALDGKDGKLIPDKDLSVQLCNDTVGKGKVGRELYSIKGKVSNSFQIMYAPDQNLSWAKSNLLRGFSGQVAVSRALSKKNEWNTKIDYCPPIERESNDPEKPLWNKEVFAKLYAIVVTAEAVLVTGRYISKEGEAERFGLVALSLDDGDLLWEEPLSARPVLWGLAVDAEGRITISLMDATVVGFST